MQERYVVTAGNGCRQVGAWSKYYRANAPIKDTVKVGCSVGHNNVQCETNSSKFCAKR